MWHQFYLKQTKINKLPRVARAKTNESLNDELPLFWSTLSSVWSFRVPPHIHLWPSIWSCNCRLPNCLFSTGEPLVKSPFICLVWLLQMSIGRQLQQFLDMPHGQRVSYSVHVSTYVCTSLGTRCISLKCQKKQDADLQCLGHSLPCYTSGPYLGKYWNLIGTRFFEMLNTMSCWPMRFMQHPCILEFYSQFESTKWMFIYCMIRSSCSKWWSAMCEITHHIDCTWNIYDT